MSTLDHLTKGRVAWNVVTSTLPNAARNFGLTDEVEHDLRYEIADEYLDVLYKLWEGSWDDDAVIQDRDNRVYTDPTKVRYINHVGPNYRVAGPHLSQPSPQRTPVICQAGASEAGREFAAKHAEAVFVGRYRESYVDGETLRERLFGAGNSRLFDAHPGARYRDPAAWAGGQRSGCSAS